MTFYAFAGFIPTTISEGLLMKPSTFPSSQESENGKYVIIKVPRDAILRDDLIPLFPSSMSPSFRTTMWVFLCIIALILGLAIGSIFHDRFLHETTDKPIWKSSALQSSDTR
jgi:hypothetical protein